MATNFFFNNFKSSQEQLLIENLIIEAIKIYGEDMYYLPRTLGNLDKIYGADDSSSYDKAVLIEMYIKSVDGFGGDGNFMSKFGLEIRDQVVFSVARRVFNEEVASLTAQIRPNEGDLIYFPLNSKCFQIKYVNKFEMFYQLGGLQTWELTCELFEYSGEVFNTGISEIDSIQVKYSENIFDYEILDEDGVALATEDLDYLVVESFNPATIDPLAENDEIQTQSDKFVDFSEHDPFSETGTF
jgi:hypothetical protein